MTNNDNATTPDVITRYLGAADAKNPTALADCFAADGTVVDEGVTYTGRAEIRGWREELAGKFTYTSVVTGSIPVDAEEHRVTAHIEGDFPGGQADLTYTFVVRDGLIAALHIG